MSTQITIKQIFILIEFYTCEMLYSRRQLLLSNGARNWYSSNTQTTGVNFRILARIFAKRAWPVFSVPSMIRNWNRDESCPLDYLAASNRFNPDFFFASMAVPVLPNWASYFVSISNTEVWIWWYYGWIKSLLSCIYINFTFKNCTCYVNFVFVLSTPKFRIIFQEKICTHDTSNMATNFLSSRAP